MPTTLSFDARGRLTVPKHLRQGLTDEVVVIKTPHGLVIHPVPESVDLDAPAKDASGEDDAQASV